MHVKREKSMHFIGSKVTCQGHNWHFCKQINNKLFDVLC